MPQPESVLTPPKYCQYASGPCDQAFSEDRSDAFFIYPSQPAHLAATISGCVSLLRQHSTKERWVSWETRSAAGLIIFCEICKSIRSTRRVVANITNLNFNVLFELGYAVGLRKPILPVRDTTYETQRKQFDEIGIFDTLGFEPFTNSLDLMRLVKDIPVTPPISVTPDVNMGQPIFLIRSPVDTDGSVKLFSSLKKSWLKFRTFDARETPRLSLHDCYKQVLSSISVVAHLIDPERTGAVIHNARCAFVAGMALAAGKHVLMLQEGRVAQPIDYRDIIIPYTNPSAIPFSIEHILHQSTDSLQSIDAFHVPLPTGLLERIDLGDIAAENEINALSTYFVKTPQFQQARQGHARIVIGRKGTGKTALFYGIRSQFGPKGDTLVLDLKPEGQQFTRLREMMLSRLTEGLQLHTLTAFWHYLLLLEVAKKLIDREKFTAYNTQDSLARFNELTALYEEQMEAQGDFSERLMTLVDRLIDRFPNAEVADIRTGDITNAIYRVDINELNRVLLDRLHGYSGVWILVDNIDKGFPTHGLQKADVLIIRCLLEGTRRLQLSMESQHFECLTTIFIRKDVFDHLVNFTPDRGKETFVNLDWSDTELIEELLLKRFRYQVPELKGSFEDVWRRLFDVHVGGESSFRYILSRTFLRPRDILNFVRKCIQIAVSRGHTRVDQEDILAAAGQFSSDMLNDIRYEVRDVFPNLPDPALAFLGAGESLTSEEVNRRLTSAGVPENQLEHVKSILLWFSFLGLRIGENESYAHEVSYDIAKLQAENECTTLSSPVYCIHPAFRPALSDSSKGS